jgi:hypothetical protein
MGGVGLNHKKERLWNPKARKCSSCSDLKLIKDKQTKTVDPNKSFCQRFGWEISNELAAKTAVCRIETSRKGRKQKRK